MRYCSFFILVAIFAAGLVSCKQPANYFRHAGLTQGTIYEIVYESPKGENYEQEIKQILYDFSQSLSTYIPTSLISRINQNDETAIVDDFFRAVFNKAVEVNRASNGAFDITIAPIVNLWGFGFTGNIPDMDPQKIDSLLRYVGMDKVRIVGDRVEKDLPGVMLNMNAIAKGYSADVIADFLKSKGSRNFLINIGGEIVARGVNDSNQIWRVGIDRPDVNNLFGGDELQAIIRLNNRAMATSGNYRRYFEIDGMKYGHTFDPRIGYPVMHNLLSVTIVADDCMTADAWATACMVSGLEKSIQLLQNHPELDAFLIYSDEYGNFREFLTDGMKRIIIE